MRKPPRTFALRGVSGSGKETLLFDYALNRRIHHSFRCELAHRMLLNPPLAPMEARSVNEIPTGDGWHYEPKWDGFRCIAFRDGEQIHLQSKAGQPLARYFPDIVHAIARLPAQQFALDGELVVPVSGALSFDELQLRLHPAASRVQKLAKAHPAMYIVFDLLDASGQSFLKQPLHERRGFLEKFARANLKFSKALRL